MKDGHAQQMEHYRPIVQCGDHLRGMGECAWATDGMAPFGVMAMQMRLNDWAHFAPWSWVNFWPNFLEGMNHRAASLESTTTTPTASDGVDGWGSPIVTFVQRALHPYLVVDRGFAGNQREGRRAAGRRCRLARRGAPVSCGNHGARQVDLFNGGLAGRVFELKWEARWDAPTGELFREGRIGAIEIEPGFHATRTGRVRPAADSLSGNAPCTLCSNRSRKGRPYTVRTASAS